MGETSQPQSASPAETSSHPSKGDVTTPSKVPTLEKRRSERPDKRSIWGRVVRMFELLVLVSSVIGLASSLVLWRVAKRQLHLVTWVRADTVLYPAEITGGRPLPLSYGGESARSVRLLDLNISNFGKQMIGSANTTWRLSLSVPIASRILLLHGPRSRPGTVVVRPASSQAASTVALEIGAFEPRAEIDLQIMALKASARDAVRVTVDTSLAGLPREVTALSPRERLAKPLYVPLIFLWVIGLSFMTYRDPNRERKPKKPVITFLWVVVVVLFFSCILGGFTAEGLGWLILRFF